MIRMVEAVLKMAVLVNALEMAVAVPALKTVVAVPALDMVQKGELEPLKNELMEQVEKAEAALSEKAEPVP